MHDDVIIVGAGQAGFQVAASLAQADLGGRIRLLGAEPEPPYERPPLSKAFLMGEMDAERLRFRPADYFADRGIALETSVTVTRIDTARRRILTSKGEELAYGTLVLATGARLKRLALPGADLSGIHYLRTVEDARALKAALQRSRRLAIVGGGYIGLEVAASARMLGCEVTIVEALDRLMARSASPAIAAALQRRHETAGVQVRFETAVRAFEGTNGTISGLELADGAVLPAGIALVGIGVVPETELAETAGLEVSGGIVVDADGRTSNPHVFAAGDCTRYAHPLAPAPVTVESVQNAVDQAKSVAAAIMGAAKPYRAVPWFWSDQYEVKLQTAGLFAPDDVAILRDGGAQGLAVVHLRDARIVAVEALNRPRDYIQARRLIEEGAEPDPERLADPDIPLKSCIA